MNGDAWFTGFTDGEGSFTMTTKDGIYTPRFSLTLRSDDLGVLERLRKTFGGGISKRHRKETGSNPQSAWCVGDKAGLRLLVEHFDRFPLRSKKSRDYAIWREATLLYCEHGRTHPALPRLFQRLRDVRAFTEGCAHPHLSLGALEGGGILQEVNRLLLHPLGMEMQCNGGELEIADYRSDPEGIYFDSHSLSVEKAERVAQEMFARRAERRERLGFVVQPVDTAAPTLTTSYINPAERTSG